MSQLDLIEKKMLLALYTPVNSAIMIETSCAGAVQHGSHQQHVTTEHLKCGLCDWGTEF